MAIHDWSNVDAGIFHDFHQAWTIEIRNALNDGELPAGYFALAEQFADGRFPDVVTLQTHSKSEPETLSGGVALLEAPPQASHITTIEPAAFSDRANRILIKHRLGDVVAVIEIVSPGNKNSRSGLRAFVDKATDLIRRGVHLLVVDLFQPSDRDPQGIHKAIWDEFQEEPFELPADKTLTVASYLAGLKKTAYVEPVAVGDELPSLPIFLTPDIYVPAPLEETYITTWSKCPAALREYVENPTIE